MSKTRNHRITKKERGLIKGGIRRAFSRSELRKQALEKALVKEYQDPNRKRVTRWGKCADCGKIEAAYKLSIDHKEPAVPVDSSFEDMSLDDLVDRMWCNEDLLQALCDDCHDKKTKAENKERRLNKKLKGNK